MAASPTVAPYGAWKSPITADLIVSSALTLTGVLLDGPAGSDGLKGPDGPGRGDVYWTEGRPAERGRNALVRRRADGRVEDVTPADFNARTRVHEYGGGAALVEGGVVYCVNYADQRLYEVGHQGSRVKGQGSREPRALTPESGGALRYADMVLDAERGRLICVREDHRRVGQGAGHGSGQGAEQGGGHEPVNELVAVRLDGGSVEDGGEVLVSGNDFYASPRISPDGRRLAWLTWNHPNMPWDGTELWVAPIGEDGALGRAQRVAGGPEESVFQPEWSPASEGELCFVSDRTGWWNLYRWRDEGIEALTELEAEVGVPQWQFGMSTYAFESTGRIVCRIAQAGNNRLALLDVATRRLEDVPTPFTSITYVRARPGRVAFIGGSPTQASSVVVLDLASGQYEIVREASALELEEGYLSAAQPVEFPTEGGLTAHAFFYPPKNRDFTAPEGERPPLIVKSHGGPTGATSSTLDIGNQFWTSRGFALLDVNYGGSAGYGRAYRERLNGQWGVVDVDDCANGAKWLAEQGLVDGKRLAIMGGSAGGYTTLCALTFRDTFQAGASRYGVSDLEALAKETHKFEARYMDRLVGPYPERRDTYVERSPIHHVERLSCPVIFSQGLDDPVVPPNQAERMVEALEGKGVPVAYVAFEGEQHGFRRAETIKRVYEAELYFYSRVFGFPLADAVEPVEIYGMASG